MMEEDDDDIYAPAEAVAPPHEGALEPVESEAMDEDEEEEDSDIEIVTEQKESDKAEPPPKVQRSEPQKGPLPKSETPQPGGRSAPSPLPRIDAPVKSTPTPPQRSGASYPAIRSSNIDVDAKPIHEPSGKSITEVDVDVDLGEADKPWRLPGADQTDYFNYGFDEFTWASYCLKQENTRKEVKDQKKQIEEMQNMFGGSSAPSSSAAMPGLGDMPPEMQQAMQSMMASGVDPSQMDFNMFMQMMNSGGQGMGAQGFGQQGQGQQQQMGGYGYGGHEGGRSGNRGRGGRRW